MKLLKAGIEGVGADYTYKNKVGPLCIKRPILNSEEIHQWFKTQGIESVVSPEDMHITVVYSREPVAWEKAWEAPEGYTIKSGKRSIEVFGGENSPTVVMKMEDKYLSDRHNRLRDAGCSHDWPEYHPHVSITKKGLTVPIDSIDPFPGPIYTGPEAYDDIYENYEMDEKSLNEPLIVAFPAIIKASVSKSGNRIVEVEASCERVDLEGDLILQKALLDSASNFLNNGHLDIDHKSEPPVAHRLGIWNPEHYIVGKPLEVKDGGNGRTFVKGEIARASDGSFDPEHRMYDFLWDSLNRTPPIDWYASVYGMPDRNKIIDCRQSACDKGATRYVIEGMSWKSLAFTKNPVNNSLKGKATVMTAKSWLAHMKGDPFPEGQANLSAAYPAMEPFSASDIMAKGHECPACGRVLSKAPSVSAWRRHLISCSNVHPDTADLFSHGIMYKKLLDDIGAN